MAKNISLLFIAFFVVFISFKTTIGADENEPKCVADGIITQDEYDAGEGLLILFCSYDVNDEKEKCYDQLLYIYSKGAGVDFNSLSDMRAAICDEEEKETKMNDQVIDISCKIGKRVNANDGAFAILDESNCEQFDEKTEACQEEK